MREYNNIPCPVFTPERITRLQPDEIFVFGSNLEGMHGGGAARVAYEAFGTVWGQGVGLQGQRYVTRIGCGIAGFRDREIIPPAGPLRTVATDRQESALITSLYEILTRKTIFVFDSRQPEQE